ncbi:MAG: SPFH domain-containing protein [Phycisphaerae bacterium]
MTSHQDLSTLGRRLSAAWLALATQAGLAITAMAVYLLTDEPPLLALFWFALVGIVIGVATAILYVFRLAEAREGIELDEAARSGRAAESIFADAEDARPASKRLQRLYRFGLPAVSVTVSVILMALGVYLLQEMAEVAPELQLAGSLGAAAALAGMSFVGFIAGRYLAGMSQGQDGKLLAGAAHYLLGTVIATVLAAAAMFVGDLIDSVVPLQILAYLLPILTIIVGFEVLLNQLLDLYRPRKAGETPRPAFDSRLLAVFGSPGSVVQSLSEAVNYQFGFEISRSWFYKLLARSLVWLVIFGIAALLAVSTLVIVRPNETAVVTRFGDIRGGLREPGLHFKLPWPLENVRRVDTTTIRQMIVGSTTEEDDDAARRAMDAGQTPPPLLWTNSHSEDEVLLLMAASPLEIDLTDRAAGALAEDEAGTDGNAPSVVLGGVKVVVKYRVGDVMAYLTTAENPEERLRAMAAGMLQRALLRYTIDEMMGNGRRDAAELLQEELARRVNAEGLGLEVMWVGISGVHPAQKVASAFHEVIRAEAERETAIENARRDATRLLVEAIGSETRARQIVQQLEAAREADAVGTMDPAERELMRQRIEQAMLASGGEAASTLAEARANRWEVENREFGLFQEYKAQLAAYRAAPDFFVKRKILDAYIEAYPGRPKWVVDSESPIVPRVDAKSESGGMNFGEFGQ